MKKIRLYFNQQCTACQRKAAIARRFDWLDRIELATEDPPEGPVPVGQAVVENLKTAGFTRGAAAVRAMCLQIPLFMPFGWIMLIPGVIQLMDRTMRPPAVHCEDGTCDITAGSRPSDPTHAEPRH